MAVSTRVSFSESKERTPSKGLTLRKHDILAPRAGPPIDLVGVALAALGDLGLALPLLVAAVARGGLLFLADGLAQGGDALAEGLVPAPDIGAALLLGLDVVRLFLGGGEEGGLLRGENRWWCRWGDRRGEVWWGDGLGV